MKRFIAFVLLATGIVACSSSCVKRGSEPVTPDATVPVPSASVDPPGPQSQLVEGPNWNFTLPSSDWVLIEDAPLNTSAYANKTLQNVVVFHAEVSDVTADTMTIVVIRELREAGATIVSSKQVEVNGHNFVLVESFKGDDQAWAWVSATGTFTYAFYCGGPSSTNQLALCSHIVNTLHLSE